MIKIYRDKRFETTFNSKNGFYIRSGIFDNNGIDTGIDPFMSVFPQILDVGIMGVCHHRKKCKINCYQNAYIIKDNMSVDMYKKIVYQCRDKVMQIALGGRGDPNKHERFEDILKLTVDNEIVPNYTTSGFGLTQTEVDLTKKYCGAVAVSWYRSDYTFKAIDMFLKQKCETNVHFVLSNSSIDEAIDILLHKQQLPNINNIIFLLYKPVGLGHGRINECLNINDDKVKYFFKLINDIKQHPFNVGFDSCMSKFILKLCPDINKNTFDVCESGRFSAYIDAQGNMSPCSFEKNLGMSESLNKKSISDVWNGKLFNIFRNKVKIKNIQLDIASECTGNCSITPIIHKGT